MDSKDIYRLMVKKCPNTRRNKHYLKRYVRFISKYIDKNTDPPKDSYIEEHHILPKADTLWPEFDDLKLYPFNMARLTARQHILCHVMLAYSLEGKMWSALHCMIHLNNERTLERREYSVYSKTYERMKTHYAYQISKRNSYRKLIHKRGVRKYVYLYELEDYMESGWLIGYGESGSSKGYVWVRKNDEEILIDPLKVELYERHGWVKGRIFTTKDLICIHRKNERKKVRKHELDYYMDEGWLIGSGYNSMMGLVKITDGINNKNIKSDELGYYLIDGWKEGTTISNASKIKRKAINDGETTKFVPTEDYENYINDGWEPGHHKVSCIHCGKSISTQNIKIHESKCLEIQERKNIPKKTGGRKKGSTFTEEQKKIMSESHKGKVWYNNGHSEAKYTNPPNDEWVRGRLKYKCRHCDSRMDKTNINKYHNDNCKYK